MSELIVTTGSEEEFFRRGKEVARLADQGAAIPDERIIRFEDPADLLKLLTATRLALFLSIKGNPGSITNIACRLHRDRSAVKRDVDELARAGLLHVEQKILPGHGRMKEVRVVAERFKLEAKVA